MLLRTAKALLFLSFLLNAAIAASAISSDPRLIQMVPPQSQVIASMRGPTSEGQPSSFLLVPQSSGIDLEDFSALTGADASRQIYQLVFVGDAGSGGGPGEHSVLVSGHFNRDAIFRIAEGGNVVTESYRGQAILVVPPLARELSRFKQLRWLAILDSDIAIFGTPASVRQELDRRIANSPPDSSLIERISRLDRRDQAWCLLPAPSPGGVIERALEKLDPELGAVARGGGSMQYGIHVGRLVEITASSNNVAPAGSNSENDPSATRSINTNYFLASSYNSTDDSKVAVVKVSKRRYDEWVAMLSKSGLTTGKRLPD